MDRNRIAYLIQRFRSNEATREELDELETFWNLAQRDDSVFNVLTDEERESIRLSMLRDIRSKIASIEAGSSARQTNFPVLSWAAKIAASVTLVVVIALYFFRADGAMNRFETAFGEQRVISLPDGSVVTLNGNSMLRYTSSWDGDQDRVVWMEGEAFFDVSHKQNDQRFIVRTEGGMNVQVLGTKFNVKVRRGKAEVMLQEGSVKLEIERQAVKKSLMLSPGELVTMDDDAVSKSFVEADKYVGWKEYRLFFDQTPLSEIAHLLEDTYGLKVMFEDKALSERRLSGEIVAADATDILSAVEEALGVLIERTDDSVTFKRENIKVD